MVTGPKYAVNPITGELVVRGAEPEDQGEYECTATNHGQHQARARLTVKSRTEIIKGPSDQEARVFTSLKVSVSNRDSEVLYIKSFFVKTALDRERANH